jgi:hypothetical protein
MDWLREKKVEMLEDFLRRQEIDIIFLQEFAQSIIDIICSYNVGTTGRGTAMVTRNEVTITTSQGYRRDGEYRQNIKAYAWSTFYAPVRNSQATGERTFLPQ